MALLVHSNFAGISARSAVSMNASQAKMGKAISHISTGKRVQSAADDVASYVAANKIKADGDGYRALANSVQNGAVYLNATDRAMSSLMDMLTAMKETSLNYAALTSSTDSTARAVLSTQFGYLSGIASGIATGFGVGGHTSLITSGNETFYFDLNATASMTASWSFSLTGLNISQPSSIQSVIDNLASAQGQVGGAINALSYMSSYLSDMASISDEAYETMTDADMAYEMTVYVKNSILAQASQAMIAQANQSMASVLTLLQS